MSALIKERLKEIEKTPKLRCSACAIQTNVAPYHRDGPLLCRACAIRSPLFIIGESVLLETVGLEEIAFVYNGAVLTMGNYQHEFFLVSVEIKDRRERLKFLSHPAHYGNIRDELFFRIRYEEMMPMVKTNASSTYLLQKE